MIYFVVKQSPQYKNITLEEFLYSPSTLESFCISNNQTNTKTYLTNNAPKKLLEKINIDDMILKLHYFNERNKNLKEANRKDLYREFYIPKKSGGLRKIDAPNPELMNALRDLKALFEEDFGVLYHTSAFAYIKNRCTLDAIKRHQKNESKWYGKYDLSDFFGSTTLEFVMSMFSMIFPFSEIVKYDSGKHELETALELAFLDGGLPQGTPISPFITNTMMIPIDFKLANDFRDFEEQRYVYTRYADDFIVSSKYDFDFKKIQDHIVEVLQSFNAPFTIKAKKTRYGSINGSNWNLGLMINKDNKITIGHKKKRYFKAMLTSYATDKNNNIKWEKEDVQRLDGFYNYYRMVEGDTITNIVKKLSDKFNINIDESLRNDIISIAKGEY